MTERDMLTKEQLDEIRDSWPKDDRVIALLAHIEGLEARVRELEAGLPLLKASEASLERMQAERVAEAVAQERERIADDIKTSSYGDDAVVKKIVRRIRNGGT